MWVLVAGQVIGGIGVGAALSVGGLIAEQLTGSASWSGTATTMLTLGAALCAIPLAGIAARKGRRPSLTLGWLTAFVGAVVAAVSASAGLFPPFLLGMVIFGSGSATNLQMRFAATDLAPDTTRGRDLSVVIWATTIGAVAGPNLTGPGAAIARPLGLPELVGPFILSAAAFAIGAAIIWVLLRPDPLVVSGAVGRTASGPKLPLRQVLRVVLDVPTARFALVAIVISHAIMVSVMAMSPVHLKGGTHVALTVVGLAISLHVAGMYALSPIVGWLADRLGRVRTAVIGQVVFLVSAIVNVLGERHHIAVMVGLILLGLGWSFALVSSSALLAESLDADTRVRASGLSDLSMNLAGAGGGALAGVALASIGYAGLNVAAAVLTVPVFALGLQLLFRGRANRVAG